MSEKNEPTKKTILPPEHEAAWNVRLIDAHCHVNSDPSRADADGVLKRAERAGVRRMLIVGSDRDSSFEAVRLARAYEDSGVYAAAGVHPHDSSAVSEGLPPDLADLSNDSRVVAVGETGLDYYYDYSPREVQQNVFRMHLEWAHRARKPVVIHVRDAMEDALRILYELPQGTRRELKLLFHCYAGGLEYLDAMRDLDAYMSLGGPVTWPKNDALREVAARIPEDRLLCETDSPWLTPKPYRGKLNEPAYVGFVYETIASVRGLSLDKFAGIVDANANRLFGWGTLYV